MSDTMSESLEISKELGDAVDEITLLRNALAALREENERLRQDAQGLADRLVTDVEDSMLAERR